MYSKIVLLFSLVVLILSPFTSNGVPNCSYDELVKMLGKKVRKQYRDTEQNTNAINMAKKIIGTEFEKDSYMVDWKLKRENQRGPWAMKGNTLVMGIRSGNIEKWVDEIGDKSFGIGTTKYSGDIDGMATAYLRVGREYFTFDQILKGKIAHFPEDEGEISAFFRRMISSTHPEVISREIKNYSLSESTFMASLEELRAIRKFLELRTAKKIVALKNDRSGIEKGEVLRPSFHETKNTLLKESCAGACSSWYNPRWLRHYDAPSKLLLATIAFKNALVPNVNAKHPLYSNFRNPNTSMMTHLSFDKSLGGESSFIQNHKWGEARGIMWAFIPDLTPPKKSKNYDGVRKAIAEWLEENES